MNESQIFISHSSADIQCAETLYNDLIEDRYWAWMDKKNLRAGEEWKPQIEENLRKSRKFIALLSSKAVESDWVKHEGSMAFALSQDIIPVNIEPYGTYLSRGLPIWAREIQLYELYEGTTQYVDQLQVLKRRLGTPLPIRQHLIQMLSQYQQSGILLDEVALSLVVRHYDELRLTRGQKIIADRLIEDSKFRLDDYWTRYEKLKTAYDLTRTENLTLKQEKRGLKSDVMLRHILLVIFAAALIFLFLWQTYFYFQSWWQSMY